MRQPHRSLTERDQAIVDATVAFLEGRLEEKETIEWALGLGLGEIDIVKQGAILHLLDRPGGVDLHEPWLSAWWLIKESWKEPNANLGMLEVEVKKRLHSKGERSEALVSDIVDLVAPRLSIKAYGKWQLQFRKMPKRPKTFRDLFQATLTSGKVVDPAFLGLQELTEDEFIVSLANTLDVAVMRGMDIARSIGWEKGDLLLHRVYYVAESERDEGMHEPDEYNQGIAPSVKFLHAVVSRLTNIDLSAAFTFISRWKQTDSPIHWRLWAAMSRDSRIASASEVGDFLLHLDHEAFWDAYRHPEIAELRARRFSEFDDATQKAITKRIRNGPSSNLWPMNEEADRVEDYRLYWIVRELKRIEVAGATLPRRDKTWLKSNITRFSDLAEMNRVDKEFLDLPKAQSVATTTDSPLDSLVGIDRLRVLEQTFPANQAWDWIKKEDNLERVLQDMESSPEGGAEFPKVWECFSLEHLPPAGPEKETNTRDLPSEARRVINLLTKLPDETISEAIKGISYWLSVWKKYIVAVPNWSVVWHRAWPLAVETTNAMQLPNEEPEHILNTPARGVVDVFLDACLVFRERYRPFDEPSDLRKMRNEVINAPGRSRLIAKYKMIELLEYFFHADKEWTKEHLISPLLADAEALTLWHAVSSSEERLKDVLEFIGHDMINKTTDPLLDRKRHSSLASILVRESLHALWEGREPVVSQGHVQQMIRLLDDEVRTYCAEEITRFVSDLSKASDQEPDPPSPEYLFQSAVKPFLEEVWPPERSLASPGISDRLSKLPVITRDEFAEAVNTIERLLVPFDYWPRSMLDYGLYGDDEITTLNMIDDETPKLSMINDEAKAEALLRLLHLTIGTAENATIPYGLGEALEQVRGVVPNLARTREYRRLETAARRAQR